MASLLPMLLIAALLLVAVGDLRHRIIPNRLNAAIALAAPLYWWAAGLPLWPDVALQVAFALVLLLVFAGTFALGLMGGGDVKLIAALALWLPAWEMARLLALMALAGGVLSLAALGFHRLRSREGQPEVPYGVAIAFAAIVCLGKRYVYPIA